jgi:hypothetical protein
LVDLSPFVTDLFGADVVNVKLDTLRLLPSLLGDETSTNFIESTVLIALIAAQPADERSNEVWLKSLGDFLGHDSLGHTGSSKRSNAVDTDVALGTLLGEGLGETPKAELGSRVVNLSERSEDTS